MKCLLVIAILQFYTFCFSQEASLRTFLKRVNVDIGLLPIPANLIPGQSNSINFVTNLDLYYKVSNNWAVGVSSYHLWLTLEGTAVFGASQHYNITSIFSRYHHENIPMLYFDFYAGKGNLCACGSSGDIYRLNPFQGTYLGLGTGLDIKLNKFLSIKPNLKAFYLLNNLNLINKGIHVRPFLTFQFFFPKENKSVINNPRF
jgi:hypothetical protein